MPDLTDSNINSGLPASLPNLLDYDEAKDMITKLVSVMEDQHNVVRNNRNLRYTEIDIEGERKAGRFAPDELFVPQHLIDSNIRREQSTYVGYLTSPARSLVLTSMDDPTIGVEPVERDITNRIRYDGWQMPMFRSIDSMQQNGYGVVEVVQDMTKPGHLAVQDVAYDDFGYSMDSKNIQSQEMLTRQYHFTKTQLLALTKITDVSKRFDKEQVEMLVTAAKDSTTKDYKQTSLYKVEKIMFRKKGVVYSAWSCQLRCNDWLRAPRPLYLGRQRLTSMGTYAKDFETEYPFFILPYTITENTTIREFKGRAYFDQDAQEAVSSLMSSAVTSYRRASYLMFSKDTDNDPNGDVATQQIACGNGKVINSKVKQFQLNPPDATIFSAISALTTANASEQSQVDFAANNRKDSRKTATEIQAAQQGAQQLSTIQIALFSTSVKAIYSTFFQVVRSRILAGLILKVPPPLMQLYSLEFGIRPAGDIDVVERAQKIAAMQQAWPVIEHTPAAQLFLSKLITLLFPEDAPQYIATFQEDATKTKALSSCLQVLTALVKDPQALSPHEQQNVPQMMGLIQQLTMILNPEQQQKGGRSGQRSQMGGSPSPMAPNGQGGSPPPQPQRPPTSPQMPSQGQMVMNRLSQMLAQNPQQRQLMNK